MPRLSYDSIIVCQNFIFPWVESVFYCALHHLGHFVLSKSGFFSYRTLVPTGSLANYFSLTVIFNLFSDSFSICSSVDLSWMSIIGRPIQYFLPFRILQGLLFIPGMSVALKWALWAMHHLHSLSWSVLSPEPFFLHCQQIDDCTH